MILFDFDGTIIDLWPRYYSVFIQLLDLKNITMDEYKLYKKLFKKDSLVANHFNRELPSDYFDRKAILLEEKEYLLLDKSVLNIKVINSLLSQGAQILSKRRNTDNFLWELNTIGIQGKTNVIKDISKKEWIESNINYNEKILIIGDSTAELEAAQLPNVEAWMVGYGMMRKEDFDSLSVPYTFFESAQAIETELKKT